MGWIVKAWLCVWIVGLKCGVWTVEVVGSGCWIGVCEFGGLDWSFPIVGLDVGAPPLVGPIKTNQGSGVTFGTCSLLRPLALYPESPICILPFAILFLSALVSEFMLP